MTQEAIKTFAIPKIKTARFLITVRGTNILVFNRFPQKAVEAIQGKQSGKPQERKQPRDPEQEFRDCLYQVKPGLYGIPAGALKKCAVEACRYVDGLPMTVARGAFHVLGDLLPIKGSEPTMRVDALPTAGNSRKGGRNVRYRAQIDTWEVDVPIRYNSSVITPEQIINLYNIAGFSVGLMEGRAGVCALGWGAFEVVVGERAKK